MHIFSMKRIKYGAIGVLLSVCFSLLAVYSYADSTRIAHLSEPNDLVVSFTFDKECVDITFISPDGQKYTKSSPEVEYTSGELWATYKISDAAKGDWSVEYKKGRNEDISYTIFEQNIGLWIQHFNVSKSDSAIDVSFLAEFKDESEGRYQYEISAVNTDDAELSSFLAKGNAESGIEESLSLDTSKLLSGNYVLNLYVYTRQNDVEVFDSADSESISYVNSNNEFKMEDFHATVDVGNSSLLINWKDYKKYSDLIKPVIKADDEVIFSNSLDPDINETKVFFPTGTKVLSISLYSMDNDMWSEPAVKNIDLESEYILLDSEDYTASRQLPIKYKTLKDRILTVSLNGAMGEYSLSGENKLYLDVYDEDNVISGYFEADNNVSFCFEKNVSLDLVPPTITLYDDIEGATISADKLTLLGKVSGASTLTINNVEVTINEKGEFSYDYPVAAGENIITLSALDANGLSSVYTVTVYGKTGVISGLDKNIVNEYLPLLISLGVSVVIIILCIIFMKKKDKSKPKTYKLGGIILWDIVLAILEAGIVYYYLCRRKFANSIGFLELAEKSVKDASEYLLINNLVILGGAVVLAVLIISVIVTVFRGKKRGKTT